LQGVRAFLGRCNYYREAIVSRKAKPAAAKREQPSWLKQTQQFRSPPFETPLVTAEDGPPRLMSKAEVCALVGVSYPTLWQMMREGRFPRSRIVGGKSMWISTELTAWMAALQVRPLKPMDAGAAS
jgi:prophage regulatory protein